MGPIPPDVTTKSYICTILRLASMLGLAEQLCPCNMDIKTDARTFRLHHLLSLLRVSCKLVGNQRVDLKGRLTIECHAQNRIVQSNWNSGRASSHSEFRPLTSCSQLSVREPRTHTHPMMSAAAVFICRPLLSGCFGTGEMGKFNSGN